jgi:ATP-dependent DNA helicase RecQ
LNKLQVLKDVYGYDCFRDGQEELIDSTLKKKDVLGIMPTGAGKSLCFQIPALMFDGITIVISPLISLMKDQVSALNEAGVHAAYINSSLTEAQIRKALENASQGLYKIIYVAPERLTTASFLALVDSIKISFVVVDEAHCISQWGQDFRPSYLKIVEFVNELPVRPVIAAYTATATTVVKEDILCILGLHNPKVVITGYDRKNLFFTVKKPENKMKELLEYLKKQKGKSGVIYCNTRSNVEEVQDQLVRHGYQATRYHAGLSDIERRENQEDFIYDKKPIMVATNAFGMGIDKSNVRFVVHYNMPKDIESYYQEAGRAGRDGETAECVLFYSGHDVRINEFLIEKQSENSELEVEEKKLLQERDRDRLRKMTFYCFTKECLREYILRYFGEFGHNYCGNCDNCLTEYDDMDVTMEAVNLIHLLLSCHERYGINVIIDAAHGAENAKVKQYRLNQSPYFGALKNLTVIRIRQIVQELLVRNYLYLTTDGYPVLKVDRQGRALVEDEVAEMIILKLPKEQEKSTTKENSTKKSAKGSAKESTMEASNPQLFERLRQLRYEIAQKEHMPPYIIFSDKTLKEMSSYLPKTKEAMLNIHGVGANKLEKYGEVFLKVILEH